MNSKILLLLRFLTLSLLFLILTSKNAISQRDKEEPVYISDSAKTVAGFILLEREVEYQIRQELATLDSIRQINDSLKRKNEKIYADLLILENTIEQKLQESYLLRQELVDALLMYEFQKSHYKALLKKYNKILNSRKPEKIMIIKKKYLLQDQDKKIFSVLLFTGATFTLAGIAITKFLQ